MQRRKQGLAPGSNNLHNLGRHDTLDYICTVDLPKTLGIAENGQLARTHRGGLASCYGTTSFESTYNWGADVRQESPLCQNRTNTCDMQLGQMPSSVAGTAALVPARVRHDGVERSARHEWERRCRRGLGTRGCGCGEGEYHGRMSQ